MKQFLSYNAVDCDFEEHNTIEDAREYLKEIFLDSEEGFHPDTKFCCIYKLEEVVELTLVDSKENYKYIYDDDIPEDDKESEAWPYDSDFDEIYNYKFVKS